MTFDAPEPGTLAVRLTAKSASAGRASASRVTVLASGRRVFKTAGRAIFKVKLTRRGATRLRRARRLRASLSVSFTTQRGAKVSVKRSVALKR